MRRGCAGGRVQEVRPTLAAELESQPDDPAVNRYLMMPRSDAKVPTAEWIAGQYDGDAAAFAPFEPIVLALEGLRQQLDHSDAMRTAAQQASTAPTGGAEMVRMPAQKTPDSIESQGGCYEPVPVRENDTAVRCGGFGIQIVAEDATPPGACPDPPTSLGRVVQTDVQRGPEGA